MKNIKHILFALFFSLNIIAQSNDSLEAKRIELNNQPEDLIVVVDGGNEEIEPEVFTIVEEMPEFPGGSSKMTKFIQKNLIFPESAMKNKTFGKCFIKFTITKDGSIKDIIVLKGVPDCKDCDEEAKRVVSIMPTWKPAKQNGKTVSAYYNLPLNFQPR